MSSSEHDNPNGPPSGGQGSDSGGHEVQGLGTLFDPEEHRLLEEDEPPQRPAPERRATLGGGKARYQAAAPPPPAYRRGGRSAYPAPSPPTNASPAPEPVRQEEEREDLSEIFASGDPLAYGKEIGGDDIPQIDVEPNFDPWGDISEDGSEPEPETNERGTLEMQSIQVQNLRHSTVPIKDDIAANHGQYNVSTQGREPALPNLGSAAASAQLPVLEVFDEGDGAFVFDDIMEDIDDFDIDSDDLKEAFEEVSIDFDENDVQIVDEPAMLAGSPVKLDPSSAPTPAPVADPVSSLKARLAALRRGQIDDPPRFNHDPTSDDKTPFGHLDPTSAGFVDSISQSTMPNFDDSPATVDLGEDGREILRARLTEPEDFSGESFSIDDEEDDATVVQPSWMAAARMHIPEDFDGVEEEPSAIPIQNMYGDDEDDGFDGIDFDIDEDEMEGLDVEVQLPPWAEFPDGSQDDEETGSYMDLSEDDDPTMVFNRPQDLISPLASKSAAPSLTRPTAEPKAPEPIEEAPSFDLGRDAVALEPEPAPVPAPIPEPKRPQAASPRYRPPQQPVQRRPEPKPAAKPEPIPEPVPEPEPQPRLARAVEAPDSAAPFGIIKPDTSKVRSSGRIPTRRRASELHNSALSDAVVASHDEPVELDDLSEDPGELYQKARALRRLARYEDAQTVIARILEIQPDNREAQQLSTINLNALEAELVRRLGNLDRSPVLAVGPRELMSMKIDSRAGYLLSMVDGMSTFHDLLDLSPMGRLDTIQMLVGLIESGVLAGH